MDAMPVCFLKKKNLASATTFVHKLQRQHKQRDGVMSKPRLSQHLISFVEMQTMEAIKANHGRSEQTLW